MELLAESYDRFFDLPMGRIGVMADILVEGDLIELRDLIIYPIGVEKLQAGVRYMLLIRRKLRWIFARWVTRGLESQVIALVVRVRAARLA